MDEKYFRVEDRLAGGNTNPYFVLLADIGALYKAVLEEEQKKPMPSLPKDEYIDKNPKIARERFGQSQLWREIAGPDLYSDLLKYFHIAPGISAARGR